MKRVRLTALVLASLALVAMFGSLWLSGCSRDITSSDGSIDPRLFSNALAIQGRYTDKLLAEPGNVGTGIGFEADGTPVIKLFTADAAATARAPKSLEGMKVVVEETGEFTAFALTGTYRPTKIGVSVGNDNECASGTIGAVVRQGGADRFILSNNHVLARENLAASNEKIDQPGRYDTRCRASGQVANLTSFYPITFSTSANNAMDAAIARFSITDYDSATPSGYYGLPSTTTVAATTGLAIKKVGRTSSLTTGTITAVNVTISVGYTRGTARFVGQFMTSSKFSKSGDSGSLVVTNDANSRPVGLLFAGTRTGESVCTPINTVLNYFNASICGKP